MPKLLWLNVPRFTNFHYFRFVTCFAIWFDLMASYMCRINLSVAIIGMSKYYASQGTNITESVQNYFLLSFNVGYLLFHIPTAMLSVKYGSRIIMLISLFFTAFFTLIFVPVAKYNHWLVIVMRILIGASGAIIIPVIQQCVANHASPSERTFYFLAIMSGNILSLIITFPLGGYWVQFYTNGWEWLIQLTGVVCLISFILHYFLAFEHPDENPWMSVQESNFINKAINPDGKPTKKTLSHYPFKQILTCPATYVFMFVHFGKLMIFYMNLFGLVKYLHSFYGLPTFDSSLYAIIPFTLDFFCHLVYHYVVDIMKKFGWSITTIRKANTFIGGLGCCGFLLGLAFVPPDNVALGVSISSLGMLLIPALQSGYYPAIIEYAPQYTLMTMSIIHVSGSFSGILQRYMTAFFISRAGNVITGYRDSFIFTSIASFVTIMIFVIFGTADRQAWAIEPKTNELKILDNNQVEV